MNQDRAEAEIHEIVEANNQWIGNINDWLGADGLNQPIRSLNFAMDDLEENLFHRPKNLFPHFYFSRLRLLFLSILIIYVLHNVSL